MIINSPSYICDNVWTFPTHSPTFTIRYKLPFLMLELFDLSTFSMANLSLIVPGVP